MAEKASGMPVSEPGSRAARRERQRASTSSQRRSWLATLGQRSLSALVLIPIVIALIFCGGWFAFAGGCGRAADRNL